MQGFPANIRVCVQPYSVTEDDHGDRVDHYGDPQPHMVIAIEPGSNTGVFDDVEYREKISCTVYAHQPIGDAQWLWTLPDGLTYRQVSKARSWAFGPWWSGGCAIALHRVEG